MNTTKKGDAFEARSYDIIQKALSSGELGIIANQSKLFRKKAYYSAIRKSNIIFDLAIEVWPPNADRYTLLYIIECKSYSKKVPVDDLHEFSDKIRQVAGLNAKGIFITDNGFQEGAYNIGDSLGIMLIQVNFDDTYKIILHKVHRLRHAENEERWEIWDNHIANILTEIFNKNTRIIGLQQLSSKKIELKAKELLDEFNPDILSHFSSVPFNEFICFVESKYKITSDFTKTLGLDSKGNDILGYFDRNEKKIYVDIDVCKTNRFPFIYCHELAHFLLHYNLKMNQRYYNSFSDSQYNFKIGKHELINDKNWIEWQANHFSSSIIVPGICLLGRVIEYQIINGIRNKGTIYLDHQPVNQKDYKNIITHLANYFGVTKTSIIYKLNELGVTIYAIDTFKHWTNVEMNVEVLNYNNNIRFK